VVCLTLMPPSRRPQRPSLFEQAARQQTAREAPLAARMRPRSFDEFVGQQHLIAPGRLLRTLIEEDRVPSMVLWGPPGSGKTTLASLIATLTRAHFVGLSAVSAGVADLRRTVEEARERRQLHQQRTILFIDEIHRFNKAQQDAILPAVEDGTVTLIGATTENPSFEVIAPLLSRSRVYVLNALGDDEVRTLAERSLTDGERGLAALKPAVEPEALNFLVQLANGDARIALNALELAVQGTPPQPDGVRSVGLVAIEEALQRPALLYDRAGDQHYDLISAFIKSLRGSDPDAALYWMARMLEAGEDPLFVARRMVILAAEDVGLADPQALVVAVAAQQAAHFVGMPEGFLPLAEAALYLATAPKSNSALTAYNRARQDVLETRADPVPLHLRNAPTALMRGLGYGKGYRYPHSEPDHYVEESYLPPSLQGRRYYDAGDLGYEARIKEWLERLRPKAQDEGSPQRTQT